MPTQTPGIALVASDLDVEFRRIQGEKFTQGLVSKKQGNICCTIGRSCPKLLSVSCWLPLVLGCSTGLPSEASAGLSRATLLTPVSRFLANLTATASPLPAVGRQTEPNAAPVIQIHSSERHHHDSHSTGSTGSKLGVLPATVPLQSSRALCEQFV